MYAIYGKKVENAVLLLDRGADVEKTDKYGKHSYFFSRVIRFSFHLGQSCCLIGVTSTYNGKPEFLQLIWLVL